MKTYIKHLLLLAGIFVTTTATGTNLPQAQLNSGISREYRTAVRAMLDAMDYETTLRNNLTAGYAQLGFDNQMVEAMIDELVGKMPDKMVEIYSKYFSLDEIKELSKVNNNEINKKLIRLTPQINQDLMQEGQCYASGKPSPSAGIKVSSDFEMAIREYFVASDFYQQIGMIQSLIEQQSGLQPGALSGLYDALPNMTVRVYSKYFTTSDINQLIAISKLPCSKKFRDKIPSITQETMDVSQRILMEYIQRILSN